MAQSTETEPQEERKRTISDALLWLILFPFILVTLFCCGQLATLLLLPTPPANTRSLLAADYKPWPYDNIRAINVPAFIKDLQKDQSVEEAQLESTVVSSVFLELPTLNPVSIGQITQTPEGEQPQPGSTLPQKPLLPTRVNTTATPSATPRPTLPLRTATATTTATRRVTLTATRTPTRGATSTATATVVKPTFTRTYVVVYPTLTPTNAPPEATQAPPPTATFTHTPTATFSPTPVTPSPTPVLPSPTPVTPSATPVTPSPTPITATPTPVTPSPTPVTPSATPVTPAVTPVTPTITPTYAPVRPIAEANGLSTVYNDPSGKVGCLAYFGYLNDNPQPVDIPLGTRNVMSDPSVQGTQPTHFSVGRQFAVVSVIWYSPGYLDWTLDSLTARAYWCNPPTP